MCRMIAAVGEIEVRRLLEDLSEIAKGNNELHERNPAYGSFKHSDGWGMSYLIGETWHTYKSLKPIYEDENVEELSKVKARAVLLHVRKATSGKISIENTQPLAYKDNEGDYIFTHNGTITEEMDGPEYFATGDSDSVRWFNKIMSDLKHNVDISKSAYSIEHYNSANFFMVTPDKIVIGQNFRHDPQYYTMKVNKKEKSIIVSSEILPTMKHDQWHELRNRSLIELNLL